MKSITIRMDDSLFEWLTEQAALNHRSKNKQIEWLLDIARRMPINNRTNVTIAGGPFPAEILGQLKGQREAE